MNMNFSNHKHSLECYIPSYIPPMSTFVQTSNSFLLRPSLTIIPAFTPHRIYSRPHKQHTHNTTPPNVHSIQARLNNNNKRNNRNDLAQPDSDSDDSDHDEDPEQATVPRTAYNKNQNFPRSADLEPSVSSVSTASPPTLPLPGPFNFLPPVTAALFLFNIAVFLLEVLVDEYAKATGLPGNPLVYLLAKSNAGIQDGQYWRIFTPLFLHASWGHLVANQYALFMLGRELECVLGSPLFAALYMLSGMWGVVASIVKSPIVAVAPSAAVFGLIAAYIIYVTTNREMWVRIAWTQLGIAALVLLFDTWEASGIPVDPISNITQLSGLLAGFVFASVLNPKLEFSNNNNRPKEDRQQPKIGKDQNTSQANLHTRPKIDTMMAIDIHFISHRLKDPRDNIQQSYQTQQDCILMAKRKPIAAVAVYMTFNLVAIISLIYLRLYTNTL